MAGCYHRHMKFEHLITINDPADFPFRRAREVVVGIRHYGDKTHRFTVQLAVCRLHGRA